MLSAKQWKETLYLAKIEARGSIYKENKMRPKTEPCETPQVIETVLEE